MSTGRKPARRYPGARQRIARKVPPSPIPREERTQYVLDRMALGMTACQIASEAQTSQVAVQEWIQNARHQLKALNAPHAVAIMKDRVIAELRSRIQVGSLTLDDIE
jgi:DNA-binding NarL/FixJ family response regulator